MRMADINDAAGLWLAKTSGALAGSAISVAYFLPAGRREAAIRFAVGVTCGLVFGSTAGLKIATELGVAEYLAPFEMVLMGSSAASLCAWNAIGLVLRLMERRAAGRIEKTPK
ncbi:hypothetical protein GCM10011385_32480 [Nitratireductor aestuarii]|uniref:Uncharacterized protein n=2 Tax=Nitratireductor aestuarii TaxID=1735103 RepID=A0A916RXT8_9HYPH|nr:hypothetical protein GCM10011385_32480 [Nitratireductor aestuarii]